MDALIPKQHAPKGRIKARPDPMMPDDPMTGAPRCTATSKQAGRRCKQYAIPGGRVCRFHGGAAPQVMKAAAERLRALEHPAITRLGELIDQKEFPSVAIAAVKDALDRIQGKAAESIAVTHSGTVDVRMVLQQRHVRNRGE